MMRTVGLYYYEALTGNGRRVSNYNDDFVAHFDTREEAYNFAYEHNKKAREADRKKQSTTTIYCP